MRQLRFIVCMCMFLSLAASAEPRPYIVDIQTSSIEGEYFADLLQLILNASKAPDEIVQIRFAPEQLSQARWIAAVAQGQGNNVIWTMTSKAREETLRPIRYPLLKGLMGYRLLVIRQGDEARFAHIKTQPELIALSAGQGMHWPDTDILRANHFFIVEAMVKENLYRMLAAKRFDFFPRGITEIQVEQDLIQQQKLKVEPHILLHYPTDLYFFVNKKNTELASRLEKGWEILLRNGAFEKFFSSYDRMRAAVELLNKHHYRVIELQNPFLTEATRTASEPYWLDANPKAR